MFEKFLNKLIDYANDTSHIQSILIVGSYAKGRNKLDSDLDLVIITTKKSEMIKNQDFTQHFGEIDKQQIEYYGACTSIRTYYKDGREIEFGIVEPSWISIPLDNGTYRVLSDGYKVLIDKQHYFEDLKL